MADISAIKLPNNTTYDIKDNFARNNLCVIMGTQTGDTNLWKGNAPFNSLEDGQRILYFLPYEGTNSSSYLNLTLSNYSLTGDKDIYFNDGTSFDSLSNQYRSGSFIPMIYKENLSIEGSVDTMTGWFVEVDKDTKYSAGKGLSLSSNNDFSLSGYVHTAYASSANKYFRIASFPFRVSLVLEISFSCGGSIVNRASINFNGTTPTVKIFGDTNNLWLGVENSSCYLYSKGATLTKPLTIHDYYISHSNNTSLNSTITWINEEIEELPENAIQATYGYNVGYVNGYTVNSDVPSNAAFTDTTYTLTEGDTNGKIKITPSIGDAYNVSVKGLRTAAYKDTTDSYSSTGTDPITGTGVAAALATLPEPMVFKGSLGTGGTVITLPTASSSNKGFTYKVITDGTYAGIPAKAGDTFISDGSNWVLIPSGDEPSGTVTSITINATSPISIDNNNTITTSGTRTISHVNSGATAGSYGDNSNQTPAYGDTFKVPYVTVNETGHVTGISEHTVKIPNSDNTDTKVSTILENPENGTYYCIPFTRAVESTEELKINNGLRNYSLEGTTESLGIGGLALGNHIPSGTEGNKQGHLYFYSSGVNYSDLYQSDLTTNITHLLPNIGGTLLNTGNFSYSPTVTTSDINSYKIGSIIINGISTDIYGKDNNTTYSVVNKTSNGLCPQLPNETTTTKYLRQDGTWVVPPNTDTKVSTVLLNPESETTYYLPFKAASESTDILNSNNGLRYSTKEGTDSVNGLGELFLGNRIATGTAGNKEGVLFLYSNDIGGSYLKQDTITGNNITHTLPSTGGTLLNTGTTSYTQVISSNTTGAYKIGSIKVNNTTTDIYGKDTTYSTGTSSVAGLTKLYAGTGTATDGTMTQNAIKTVLESKADSAHTHSYITDIADGTVTSFGYSKAVLSEDDYTYLAGWVELEGGGYQLRDIPKSRFATASHTHNYASSDSEGGAANSLKYFKNTSTTDVGVDDTTANAIGYVSGLTQASWNNRHTYGALYKQIYDSSWGHEIFGDYYNGHLAVRGKTNNRWSEWSAVLDSSNYSNYSNLKQIAKQNIGNSSSSISFTISGNFHNNSSSGEISVISPLTFKIKGVYLNSETTNPVSGTLDLCGFVGSSYSRSVWNVMATTLYAGISFSEASSNSTFFRANGIRDLAYVTVSHDLTSSNSTGTVTVTFNNFQSAGGIVSLDYDSSVYTVS